MSKIDLLDDRSSSSVHFSSDRDGVVDDRASSSVHFSADRDGVNA